MKLGEKMEAEKDEATDEEAEEQPEGSKVEAQ